MAKPTVYIETSIISYLAARPSGDLVTAGNQRATHDWWETRRNLFDVFISSLVLAEISAGDSGAAKRRRAIVEGLPLLVEGPQTNTLARRLLADSRLPAKALTDCTHIAIAASNGTDFLLTWNCKHIANAEVRRALEQSCRALGFEPPTICVPTELLGDRHHA
jgi:hypothetical protein